MIGDVGGVAVRAKQTLSGSGDESVGGEFAAADWPGWYAGYGDAVSGLGASSDVYGQAGMGTIL